MAKPRSGLGRGLSTLMGTGEIPRVQPYTPPAAQKQPEPEKKQEEKKVENVVAETVTEPPKPIEPEPEPTQEIYSNEDDHVVIKSVVEREVVSKPVKKEPVELVDENGTITAVVDIDLVVPNPNQPRTNFKNDELEELAESIKKDGLLQPILVRKTDDGYQIIAGERRWQACKRVGMKTVSVRIKEASDYDTIALALVENLQRSDLNPIEEAYGYRRMMEHGKMTQSEVAQAVSKGRSTIANALRLLDLPEDAQQLLFEEKITAGHARAILSVPDSEGRKKLTEKLLEKNLSVRETEAIARLMAGKKDAPKRVKEPAPKSYKTVARSLAETLGAEVRIKSSKGKNRIEVEFKDEADLERLYRLISRPSN